MNASMVLRVVSHASTVTALVNAGCAVYLLFVAGGSAWMNALGALSALGFVVSCICADFCARKADELKSKAVELETETYR